MKVKAMEAFDLTYREKLPRTLSAAPPCCTAPTRALHSTTSSLALCKWIHNRQNVELMMVKTFELIYSLRLVITQTQPRPAQPNSTHIVIRKCIQNDYITEVKMITVSDHLYWVQLVLAPSPTPTHSTRLILSQCKRIQIIYTV